MGDRWKRLADFRPRLAVGPRERIRASSDCGTQLGHCRFHATGPARTHRQHGRAGSQNPKRKRHDFHYRGGLARADYRNRVPSFGLTVIFDDNFPNRRVRFDVEDV